MTDADSDGSDATPDHAVTDDPAADDEAVSEPDSDDAGPSSDAVTAPSFEIPARPERRFPSSGGLEYEGETVFTLAPDPSADDATLTRLVERVLDDTPYTYGDWFDLPMPLYLVHDEETGDVFRVAVRDGRIEFHVLPATESPGLRALYDRILAADGDRSWRVDCRIAAE